MMLEKEASIVADSTMSSSPAGRGDMALQIKRATRTYGKRREDMEEAREEGPTDSAWSMNSGNIHKTAPPDLKETIPPSSPDLSPMESDVLQNDESRRSPISQVEEDPSEQEFSLQKPFAWQKGLSDIDKAFEDDIFELTSSDKPKGFLAGATLPQGVYNGLVGSTSTHVAIPPYSSDRLFNTSPPTLSYAESPVPSPQIQIHRRHIVRDSDSEDECRKGSPSTAPSTSEHNSFFSMKSRSSSTEPTSDDNVPPKAFVGSKPSQSRKLSSRVSVPPLELTELSSKDGTRGKIIRKSKIKAPTKKELRETAKERSRLAAQASVTVRRAESSSTYTLQKLLKRVSGQPSRSQPSDPIEPFTSPVSPTANAPTPESHSPPKAVGTPRLPEVSDSSEDELPEVTELLQENFRKEKIEQLKEMKKRVLAQRTELAYQNSDDDLVISTDPKTSIREAEDNRRLKQSKVSMARKTVAQLAHVNLSAKVKKTIMSPKQLRKGFPSSIQHIVASGSSMDLQREMFARGQEHASREVERKENEWKKHGGYLAQRPAIPAEGFECTVKAIAGKGLEVVDAEKSSHMEEGDDEDDEWIEMQASAPGNEHEDRTEIDENAFKAGDSTMAEEEENADDSDTGFTEATKSKRNLVLSDSEDEGINKFESADPVFRESSMSSGLATEDEYDKENNTKLVFDHGEDKENKRVVRHPTGLSSPESPRDFTLGAFNSKTRMPFQELLSEESPKTRLFVTSTSSQSFVSKLQQASFGTLAPGPALQPFLPEGDFAGFSQFSQSDSNVLGTIPLQPGFSELFESGTEVKSRIVPKNPFKELLTDQDCNSSTLLRENVLDLTQDVVAAMLQPAFQAEESVVRKAESIFDREQAFVVEVNTKKNALPSAELYVNELGFLTQTMPLDSTPEVYHRTSPMTSAIKSLAETPSQRMPLQTLSLASPSRSEVSRQDSFRRLRRATDAPQALSRVQPLGRKDLGHRIKDRKGKRVEFDNLFEDEAAESDDDRIFGFVVKKPADDEDGEDLDQNLPELVDDQKMDADIEAADLVFDKYKEHLEEDDKKLEDLHKAAIQGQLRQKRNRGVGVDDSDDDSDADDNERARRAMKRARRSDRTDIRGLEENDETRAFADTYNQSLRDEDDFFSFIGQENDIAEIVDGHPDDKDNVENEEVVIETVDSAEVRKELQARIREGRLEEEANIDVDDVSWLDQDDVMEDAPRVKNVDTRQVRKLRPEISDLDTMSTSLIVPTKMNQAAKQWFAQESQTRNASTARKSSALAVTGHTKRERVTDKGHSSSSRPPSAPAAPVRQVRAAASALSIIADSRSFA